MSAFRQQDLDQWVRHGLITEEQRTAILEFERSREAEAERVGPGRLANAVSTIGAAIAIAAVVGIVLLFRSDWSSGQSMVVTAAGSLVLIAAAWQLVRNGWGAPAGLCALSGLVLIPVALVFAADALGWWPEYGLGRSYSVVARERERVIRAALLLSILPILIVTRLGLRQPWAVLPGAIWFGLTLRVTGIFENTGLTVAQVVYGATVAGIALFAWHPSERGRGTLWWLQLGGLLLVAIGIALSAGQEHARYAFMGVTATAVIFGIGVVRGRTAWLLAGALPAIFPIGRLIFEYFTGLAGLLLVAVAGLAVTFVPLIIWRRGHRRQSRLDVI